MTSVNVTAIFCPPIRISSKVWPRCAAGRAGGVCCAEADGVDRDSSAACAEHDTAQKSRTHIATSDRLMTPSLQTRTTAPASTGSARFPDRDRTRWPVPIRVHTNREFTQPTGRST
ncbi:hypothetical protein MTER_26590 [Mycolicibacter terrae]|uniref:Uncharacterized protein n=1 Tax=Mycolicibacter terrae TaxID=1788 RepID=A0AAD1MH78_9MYCO|nr:hypothetical protein MTER_26590 [Mycolicibacter terrae]